MSSTLISFLGRGPYSPDGNRVSYRTTRYCFADLSEGAGEWTSEGEASFAEAIRKYRDSCGEPFSRIVILGTTGSMWDALVTTWAPDNTALFGFAAETLCDLVDQQAVDESHLAQYANLFNRELDDACYRFRLIPSAGDLASQGAILDAILQEVDEQSHVWLDVTHGFRHLPMLSLVAAAIAAPLKQATIEQIVYGALDMSRDGVTPVISLNWILRLFRTLSAVDEITRYQRIRPIIDCFPGGGVRTDLENAAFRLDTMRIDEAALAVGRARNSLKDKDLSSMPELQVLRPLLLDRLSQFAKRQRDLPGLTSMAEAALQERDYLRTAVFLAEAVEKARQRALPGDDAQDDSIKSVRNALAHAGQFRDGSPYFETRAKLEDFLTNQIKRFRDELAEQRNP